MDEPLEFEDYAGTTAPGTGSAVGLFANRLGSILSAVTLSTGAVAADYDYDSFGARTETGALEQPYGFTGREHDAESGLIHFRGRTYDPASASFLQSDPLGFRAGDLNLYAYVENNPQRFTDPSGYFAAVEYRNLALGSASLALGACTVSIECRDELGQVSVGAVGSVMNGACMLGNTLGSFLAQIGIISPTWRDEGTPPPPGGNGPPDDEPDAEPPKLPLPPIPPYWPDYQDDNNDPKDWRPETRVENDTWKPDTETPKDRATTVIIILLRTLRWIQGL